MNEFPWIGPTDWGLLLTSPIVLYLGVIMASSFKPKSLDDKDLTIGIFTAPSHLTLDKQVSLIMPIQILSSLAVAAMISLFLATGFLVALCYSGLLTFVVAIMIEVVIALIGYSYEITSGWQWVVTFNAFLLIIAAVSSRLKACLSRIQQRQALFNSLCNHFILGRNKNGGEPITLTEEKFAELCDSFFPGRDWMRV